MSRVEVHPRSPRKTWNRARISSSDLVFQEPGTENGEVSFYQFVPDAEHYPDYRLHIFELLSGIAEFEDRQASVVIDDILQQAGRRSRNGAGAREQVDADVRA
jgi:hypothetical protein